MVAENWSVYYQALEVKIWFCHNVYVEIRFVCTLIGNANVGAMTLTQSRDHGEMKVLAMFDQNWDLWLLKQWLVDQRGMLSTDGSSDVFVVIM